ncbi:MAG: inositol monophosphatase [Myxococcota bacterium]
MVRTVAHTLTEDATTQRPAIAEAAALLPILQAAGEPALALQGRAARRNKQDGSVVTEADVQAQEIIGERLAIAFPGCPIVGEEDGLDDDPGRGQRWYGDPIDGTAVYVEGLAHWGPTVCLVDDDGPVVGALWLPRLGELWFAKRGGGAWHAKDRLRCEPQSRVHSSDVLYVPSRFHHVSPFPWPGKTRSLGSTAVHLALVATGSASAALVGRYAPWDVACGLLLVEEAGRVITDPSANPVAPMTTPPGPDGRLTGGQPFLAGDPTTIDYVARLLGGVQHP